jgi:hypothetical protein
MRLRVQRQDQRDRYRGDSQHSHGISSDFELSGVHYAWA